MTKIIVGDLHDKLTAAGLPVLSVRLTKAQKIELVYPDDAKDEQKAAAELIAKDYDQDAVDAAKVQPVTLDEINAIKTVADVKALMIRQYLLRG